MDRQSKRMTDTEWNTIKHVAMRDPERMRLFHELDAIHTRMGEETYEPNFGDVDKWHNTKIALIAREWELLNDWTKPHQPGK